MQPLKFLAQGDPFVEVIGVGFLLIGRRPLRKEVLAQVVRQAQQPQILDQLIFGEPFHLHDLALGEPGSEQEVADAIMRRVAQLLPPRMRGYYTDIGKEEGG